jgi:hypothetical protein
MNRMPWYQLAFAGLAAYILYRIIAPAKTVTSGFTVSPAVAAGATGSAAGGVQETPAGVTDPQPDLGYNFSLKANNVFSPSGGSSAPTFLAYESQLNQALAPVVASYMAQMSGSVH